MIGTWDPEADAKADEVYHRHNAPPALPDPYENVKILYQAKPKLVEFETTPISREGLVEMLGISGQPTDIPTFEDHPVYELNVNEVAFEADLLRVYGDARRLCLKKHQDYGSRNISLSPGGPLNGLRVRLWDKMARINNLIDSGAEPANESLRDSFVDLMNYSAIALMVIDGNWPSE